MNILELKHAKKSFDGVEVLKDIDLSVSEGQVVSIIGPSGSGKSTLLRCATFLETLDDGSLSYQGQEVVHSENGRAVYGNKAQIKQAMGSCGFVFQNFNLFPHFSVLKNITDAPIRVQKRPKEQVEAEARELLKKMGLADRADAYPCQLSGGQQQRVSIARALALKPAILFFDEPTSALDPELVGEVLNVIRKVAAEGVSMVIVTHEMNFAREVADRILFMEDGVIVEDASPEEFFEHPKNERIRQFIRKVEER